MIGQLCGNFQPCGRFPVKPLPFEDHPSTQAHYSLVAEDFYTEKNGTKINLVPLDAEFSVE